MTASICFGARDFTITRTLRSLAPVLRSPGSVADRGEVAAGATDPLTAFLTHAALEAGDTQAAEGRPALQLMTVHSAKGLEFHTVFVTGLEEGLFPHENSRNVPGGPEEERRLMYVALTRPRNYLSVTYPLNAYSSRRGAEYSLDQLCRFIDRGVRDNMQRVALGTDNAPAADEAPKQPLLDLRALLRGRPGSREPEDIPLARVTAERGHHRTLGRCTAQAARSTSRLSATTVLAG